MAFGVLCWILALLVAAGQSLVWLSSGVWPDLRLYDVLHFIYGPSISHSWLYSPIDMFGLHKIVWWFIDRQLAAFLFLMGLVGFLLAMVKESLLEQN